MLKVNLICLSFLLCVLSCSTGPKKSLFQTHPLAVVQGTTDSTQTFITVLSQKTDGDLKFFVSLDEKKAKRIPVYSFFKKMSPDQTRLVEKLHIKGLENLKTYKLIIQSDGKTLDERSFKTLNPKRKNIRIGVASCMDDHISASQEMWQSYLNKFLDVNFFIGDNVYADRLDDGTNKTADEEQLWLRYAQTWDRLYFYHSSQLSPTYYLWDDHDYGQNDGGAGYQHRDVAKKIFWTFSPNEEIAGVYKKTKGAGSILDAFDQKFLFIDGRYFRQNQKGIHWGKGQKTQIFSALKNSKAKINWLIQGDQFFGAYHPFESFEKDNPVEFKRTLKGIKKTKKKVVFLSGDRHLTEIMTVERPVLGYETYEITSSGIHAKVFPGSFLRSPNPRGLVGKSGVYNYSVIELRRNQTNDYKFKVTSYGAKDWTHYTKELSF